MERDKQRTGKLASTKLEWAERPNKFDWQGIDTADSKKRSSKKFSTGMIKTNGKLAARKSKSPISAPLNRTLPFKTFSGLYRDVAYTVNADTRMMSFKWDFSKHKGYHTYPPAAIAKLKDTEMNIYAVSKHDAMDNVKRCIDIFHRGWDNIFYAPNRNLTAREVAEATKPRKHKGKNESANSRIGREGIELEEKFQNSLVNGQVSQLFKDRKNRENVQENQAKVKAWALTPAAQAVTPKASFLVYDFLTGRYENTLKDIDNGKVTKPQVYKILGKINSFRAMPKSVVANYIKKIKAFKPQSVKSPRYSVTSIKHPSKLSGRKSKSAPKFVGEHVTKEIKRPKLSLSAVKSPTKPSNRKEKVQLKGSGKGVLKHIEVSKPVPVKTAKKRKVSRDKLSIAERAPAVPTKPIEKRISPIKVVTINGKQYTISANNALAFLTELKSKQAKNKLASMIKQAKAKELKGKDVSEDWANIVTFISQNMGATNLKRLPTTASGYARFMGKKNDYQRINEKAYQIKKRDEEIKKNLGPIEKEKADLKYAQDLLTRAEKDMVDLKKKLKDAEENHKKGRGTYDLVQLLKREIEKQKDEIKEDKYLVKERTKKLEARTPKPHPNNRKARLARAKLPKYSLSKMKHTSKLSNRKEKRVLNISKKSLYKNVSIPSGKYRYASFMRPLGMWFNPGVTFKIESVTDSDRDIRFNRMPHSVISTSKPLSKNVVDKFELTDLTEGKGMQELIKYINKFDFLNDSMKNQLESLILKGKDKAYIDQYIDKARKMAEKKGNSVTTSTYTPPKSQPTTLKEINIRLDELKPILKPFYESNRKPTPYEALAVKEADALVRKRDGIIARSDIAYKKKELASKTTSYTDKSVRDLPQKASVYNGLITVNSYVGRKLAGSYNLSIDTWIKTERFGNSAYNKAELINRAFKGDGAGGDAQRQRIIDSQISAIDHVMKMLK